MLSMRSFQGKINMSNRLFNFRPAVDVAAVSEMAPLMGDYQINPGGSNPPAAHFYNAAPPVQFIHYAVNSSGPAQMDTKENVIYPNNL